MGKITLIANASKVEATKQQSGGVVDPEVIDKLNKGKLIGWDEFLNECIWAYDNRNRAINVSHVKYLKEKILKTKCMVKPIEVVPATRIIEVGGHIFEDKECSKEIDSSTKDISNMFVVVDGQHRRAAMESLTEEERKSVQASIVSAQIPEGMSVYQYMSILNNDRREWTALDRAKDVVQNFSEEGETVISIMTEKYCEGFSMRSSYALLQMKDDYKRSMLVNSQNDSKLDDRLKGNSDNNSRRKKLFDAVNYGFRNQSSLGKNLDLANAVIKLYDAASDDERGKLIDDLVLCISALTDDEVTSIKDAGRKDRCDTIHKILEQSLATLKATSGTREKLESRAESNKKEYEQQKNDQDEKAEESKRRSLKSKIQNLASYKLGLSKIKKQLSEFLMAKIDETGYDKVEKFVSEWTESDIIEIKERHKNSDTPDKLSEKLSKLWTNYSS